MSIASEQPLLSPVSPATELPAQPAAVATEARSSRKATWALVCGIAGLIVLPLLFSTVAIALGVVARNEIARDPQLHGQGKEITGITLGVIGLVLFAIIMTARVVSS